MASVSEFVIRADAGPGIGLGHMLRCLPAAQELLRAGSRVTFAVRNAESLKILEQVLPQFPIAAEQMERVCLSGMKAKSGEAACDTAAALAELAAEHSASAVLLDTYAVDPQSMLRLKEALHQSGTSLWYLDDLLAFPYPADGVINYSFYADRAAYEKLYQESDQNVTCPELLLGPSYVPLREEFRGKREVSEKAEDSLPSVLLLTGGTDPCHVLAALLEMLKDAFEVTAVIGAMNPKAGCAGSVMNLLQIARFNHQVEITRGVLGEACGQMLSEFFRDLRRRKGREDSALAEEPAADPENEPDPEIESANAFCS